MLPLSNFYAFLRILRKLEPLGCNYLISLSSRYGSVCIQKQIESNGYFSKRIEQQHLVSTGSKSSVSSVAVLLLLLPEDPAIIDLHGQPSNTVNQLLVLSTGLPLLNLSQHLSWVFLNLKTIMICFFGQSST